MRTLAEAAPVPVRWMLVVPTTGWWVVPCHRNSVFFNKQEPT